MSEELKTEVLETPDTTEEMKEVPVEVVVPEEVKEVEVPVEVEAPEEVEAPDKTEALVEEVAESFAPEAEATVAPTDETEAEEVPAEKTEAEGTPAQETEVEVPVETEEVEAPDSAAEQVEAPVEVVEEAPTESMADYEENFDDANPWNLVTGYMQKKTVLPVKVEGVVNGGAIAMVEGLRGFIPASKLSLSYIENLETFLLQDIEVQVIDVDQANNRLVLSARDILRKKERAAREEEIRNVKIGSVMSGKVETLQNYGAFVKLENGLSGLVHVSQISQKRIKTPGEVLKVGDTVEVKIIGVKDGKISLSMKALKDPVEEVVERVVLPKSEEIGTSLGDLFKNIKL